MWLYNSLTLIMKTFKHSCGQKLIKMNSKSVKVFDKMSTEHEPPAEGLLSIHILYFKN